MVGSDELCMMTAGEALAAFRARRLSPVELMQAVIARVEKVNPALNAFTYTFFERALEQARRAEAKYLKSDGRPRPLEGIPVAIKDLHPVKGEITTFGSKAFADNRPDHTAPTVERLLRAGAILHARTTTPESPSGTTYSALWGVTRNPWNTAYSPGGSSGGAGAALATGMTMLADGTDAGGSIRIPASACGIDRLQAAVRAQPARSRFPARDDPPFRPAHPCRRRCRAHAERNVGAACGGSLLAPDPRSHPRKLGRDRGLARRRLARSRLQVDRSGGRAKHARCRRRLSRSRVRRGGHCARLELRRAGCLPDPFGSALCRDVRASAAALAVRDGSVSGRRDRARHAPRRRTGLSRQSRARRNVPAALADPRQAIMC